MALSDIAIVELEDAKTRLKESGSENDAVIESMVNYLSGLFEDEVERPIKNRTVTDYRIDGSGTADIYIPVAPIVSLTSFSIRYDSDDTVYVAISDSSEWIIKDATQGHVRLINEVFLKGTKNVLVTASVGYEATNVVFQRFQEAMYIALDDYYRRWNRSELSLINKSYPDGSAQLVPAAVLPPIVKQMLAPYHRYMAC